MKTKIVKTRDSATTILRKMGINQRDYNLFLEKVEGGVEVKLELAELALQGKSASAPEKPKKTAEPGADEKFGKMAAKKAPKAAVKAEEDTVKPAKLTVSAVIRNYIAKGLTNEEIWAKIKDEFKLDDNKRHYPAWYRSDMKRKQAAK